MIQEASITINDAYLPYLNCEKRVQIFYGGSSSGKSFFLAQRTVLDNLQKGANYLICRNVAATIRNSIFNEVVKAIGALGFSKYYSINVSNMCITCLLNGKQILFAGLDNAEKLKSITPQIGVIERIHIEEATEVKREAYLQLRKRLRGTSDVKKCIILSFNPILKSHWIYKEFFGNWDESKTSYQDANLSILKTTYKDNLFLAAEDKAELEHEADPYFYNVYSLGNWGVLGNVVFKNWTVEDLSERKKSFGLVYAGMDFGFSADPTAFIKASYDSNSKTVYIFEEHYQTGMHNDDRIKLLKERLGREYVICDSASPELIDDFCRHGIRAVPAIKGVGSILSGIDFLQRQKIVIDVSCQNFKNELSSYHWEEDKYGNALQRPVGRDDHGIDALRYALEPVIRSAEAGASSRI